MESPDNLYVFDALTKQCFCYPLLYHPISPYSQVSSVALTLMIMALSTIPCKIFGTGRALKIGHTRKLCFFLFFDFIVGILYRGYWGQGLPPLGFEISPRFLYFLRLEGFICLVSLYGNSYTMIFIVHFKYRYACGESNLHQHVQLQNFKVPKYYAGDECSKYYY